MLAQKFLARNDIESPADAGSAFFDKVPAWIDSATAMAESAASDPMIMAVGTLCVAGLVTITIGGPRVLRQAAGAVRSDPSDLYVGDRDGGKLFGKLPGRLAWPDRCTGVRITGPTGSGKTTVTTPLVMDDLLAGRDVFIMENHGDLGTEVRKRAEALGADILSCDASEKNTMYWNLLAGDNTEDVANRVSTAIASSVFYHGYYGPIGKSFVRAFVRLAREYKEFYEEVDPSEADWELLTNLITDSEFLHRVLKTTTKSEKDKTQIVGARWVSARTRKWFNSEYLPLSERDRQQNRSNVATLFEDLADSRGAMHMLLPAQNRRRLDLYEQINQPSTKQTLTDAQKSDFRRRLGRLIVVRAPVQQSGMGESEAKTIGYLTFRTLIDATLERDAPEVHVKPMSVYLDEMPSLMGQAGEETQREVASWLTLVRDKNVAPHLIFQGHAMMPRILLDALDATCRNFLIMPGASADEVEFYRKTAGVVETEVTDSRTSYSRGGKTHSEGSHMAEKKRLAFDEIKYLHRGEAIYMGVKDNADEIPVKVATRRAPEPEYYEKLRKKAEAREEAARQRARERAAKEREKEMSR